MTALHACSHTLYVIQCIHTVPYASGDLVSLLQQLHPIPPRFSFIIRATPVFPTLLFTFTSKFLKGVHFGS